MSEYEVRKALEKAEAELKKQGFQLPDANTIEVYAKTNNMTIEEATSNIEKDYNPEDLDKNIVQLQLQLAHRRIHRSLDRTREGRTDSILLRHKKNFKKKIPGVKKFLMKSTILPPAPMP